MKSSTAILPPLQRLLDKSWVWNAAVIAISVLFLLATGDQLSESPAFALSMVVMVAGVALMLIDYRLALMLFVGFLFAYEEFNLTSERAFVEENIANTVLAVKVFGFALMDVASMVFFLPVLLKEWSHAVRTGHWRWFRGDLFMLPLLFVWLYGLIPGMANMLSFSAFTWDLRMLVHVGVFYFIFSRAFDRRRDYFYALLVGGGLFLLKHSVFFYRYLTGGGLQTGAYHRVFMGSDLPLTAVALVLSVASILIFQVYWNRESQPQSGHLHAAGSGRSVFSAVPPSVWKYTILLLTAYFTVMLIAGLGKLTYLQATYSLLLVLVLHRAEIRLRSVLIVIGVGAAAALLVFFTALTAENRETISYALTSAFNWWDALKLYGDLSFGTRLLEIINIWEQLQREGALLLGMGWGSAWKEVAMHMPFDRGAFGVEEQYTGIHVQAHIDAITFLLKVGIVGTLVIYASMLRYGVEALRLYRSTTTPWQRWTLLALLLMIIVFVPNFLYFIRLKYLLGFAFAGITIFVSTHDNAETDHSSIADPDDAE